MGTSNISVATAPAATCPLRSLQPGDQLRQAREDATVLLAYAVQSDHAVGADKTNALIDAIEALDAADRGRTQATHAQRSEFWKAYEAIATTMAPVSAFSLRKTTELMEKKWWTKPFAPTTGLALLAIVVFTVSLFAQYCWVTGRDLLDQAGELSKQKSQAVEQLWKLRDEGERIAAERSQLQDAHPPSVLPAGTMEAAVRGGAPSARSAGPTVESNRESPRNRAKLDLLAEAEQRNKSAMRPVQRQVEALGRATADIEPALLDWYRLCPRKLCERGWLDSHELDVKSRKGRIKDLEAQLAKLPVPAIDAALRSAKLVTVDARRIELEQERDREQFDLIRHQAELSRDLVHRARMFLRAADAYVIPMLMGWLGALTFMLRTLVLQLRNHSYTPAFASISFVRMVLGMMAGALGGMFVPSADNALKALPPMALPFVFGYGVEILFSFLDRIVNAFPATAAKA